MSSGGCPDATPPLRVVMVTLSAVSYCLVGAAIASSPLHALSRVAPQLNLQGNHAWDSEVLHSGSMHAQCRSGRGQLGFGGASGLVVCKGILVKDRLYQACQQSKYESRLDEVTGNGDIDGTRDVMLATRIRLADPAGGPAEPVVLRLQRRRLRLHACAPQTAAVVRYSTWPFAGAPTAWAVG